MKRLILILHSLIFASLTNGQVVEGLVGYFPFTDGSLSDFSGYQDCILSTNGDSTYFLTKDRFGNLDYAINFQGAVLDAGIQSRNITTEVTVSLWLMTTDTTEDVKFIINKYYGVEPPLGYHLALKGDSVTFDGRDNTAKDYMRSGWSETAVNDGNWHHVVGLARSEGVWEVWVDGQKENSNEYSTLSSLNHSYRHLGIAGTNKSNSSMSPLIYKGALDDIKLYNRALDSTEINMLYKEANPITNIREYKLNSINLNIYPNPSTSSIIIKYELTQPETVKATIYSLSGKQVDIFKENNPLGLHEFVWTPENLPNGIYYFKIEAGNQVATRKIVLVR